MIIPAIVNIAEICARKGINHIIVSPGSRCAHLTIAFVRHPHISTYSISDERSAAFIALGMAQRLQKPVALLCTSGTAALNYYPAIAEAYYQKIPLLVLTADRPDEWIDQQDGQTIRQQNVYANHIKKSYHMPVDYSHEDAIWHSERILNEAINLTNTGNKGPVHVNIPIREPFYPEQGESMSYNPDVRIIRHMETDHKLSEDDLSSLFPQLDSTRKIMILAGQQSPNNALRLLIDKVAQAYHLPVLVDVISNMSINNSISHTDITLFDKSLHQALQPDLVISFGDCVLSKNLKSFLRANKPKRHVHLQCGAEIADYTKSIDTLLEVKPEVFFDTLSRMPLPKDKEYLSLWQQTQSQFMYKLEEHFKKSDFSEFECVYEVLKVLPEPSVLHLANSMSVRYANYLKVKPGVKVYANRGTSGIDGCTSTALGHALICEGIVTLITGDMAFLYDRNALWNNYIPDNLRIIVLNNHAGGIFRIIEGPNRQPELKEYFETIQRQNAQSTALDAPMEYIRVRDRQTLKVVLGTFFEKSSASKVLEVFSDSLQNTDVLKSFTSQFKSGSA